MTEFTAYLHNDLWLGCTRPNKNLVTSYCPSGYCNSEAVSMGHVEVPKTCELTNDWKLCVKHRTGQLCGECEQGYTVYHHSYNFLCKKCRYGAAGLVIYIFAELIPLALLFGVLVTVKLNLASGFIQSILLFAQTITVINRATSFIALSHKFIEAHNFLLGFFNLELFSLDILSFCLWSGATVLDNLLFHYVTTLFAIILLVSLILAMKSKYGRVNLRKIGCKSLVPIHKSFKTPIIHSISTFLILPYTQYTVTSFQILALLPLYGKGGKPVDYVVRLQGNVEYMGTDHLPYAIPAVLIILFLSIPPPLLLISYPLLWKIKAKLRPTEDDTTIWPIRKHLPLIDSFQGVFRDNCRMFAGLLLLWRLVIAAIFAFSVHITFSRGSSITTSWTTSQQKR